MEPALSKQKVLNTFNAVSEDLITGHPSLNTQRYNGISDPTMAEAQKVMTCLALTYGKLEV